MLDCKHASHLISQSLDVRLSWRQRVGLKFHLMLCDACTQFSSQMGLLRAAVRQAGQKIENDAGLKLSQDARNRIAGAVDIRKRSIAEAQQHPDQHLTN